MTTTQQSLGYTLGPPICTAGDAVTCTLRAGSLSSA